MIIFTNSVVPEVLCVIEKALTAVHELLSPSLNITCFRILFGNEAPSVASFLVLLKEASCFEEQFRNLGEDYIGEMMRSA